MVEILYCRVSNVDQKTDYQRANEKDFKIVIEDICSGSVPFFEREGGKQVLTYINNGLLTCLSVSSIDRLGRNLRDILNTINFFNEKNIPIIIVSLGLRTIDENGNEIAITKVMISKFGNI